MLAYFGWPRAYEDQSERAVRSGLDAVTAVTEIKLESGLELHARVGIATGEVVVGDIIGETSSEAGAVTGETPNLAARLESLAKPDQVVIGATTHQLVSDIFEYADLGLKTIKGFAEPVQVWQVLTEGRSESRFEATHHGELVRFVGREHELGLLLERWALAKSANRVGAPRRISKITGRSERLSRPTSTMRSPWAPKRPNRPLTADDFPVPRSPKSNT